VGRKGGSGRAKGERGSWEVAHAKVRGSMGCTQHLGSKIYLTFGIDVQRSLGTRENQDWAPEASFGGTGHSQPELPLGSVCRMGQKDRKRKVRRPMGKLLQDFRSEIARICLNQDST
jgi:hypothetical protein